MKSRKKRRTESLYLGHVYLESAAFVKHPISVEGANHKMLWCFHSAVKQRRACKDPRSTAFIVLRVHGRFRDKVFKNEGVPGRNDLFCLVRFTKTESMADYTRKTWIRACKHVSSFSQMN